MNSFCPLKIGRNYDIAWVTCQEYNPLAAIGPFVTVQVIGRLVKRDVFVDEQNSGQVGIGREDLLW